jgi:NTE family protein
MTTIAVDAHAPAPIRNLVFAGGGVKGLSFVGAMQVLDEEGVLAGVTGFAGASAGAITAVLLACGYSPAEMEHIMSSMNFKTFEDGGGILSAPMNVLRRFGRFRGAAFLKWVRARIADKMGDEDITFADLRARTGKDLRVVGTNLSTRSIVVFSPDTTPDMPVSLATRISMSIPLFFEAVVHEGQTYVDGGTVWNYPLTIFDTLEDDPSTLGFHLDSSSRDARTPQPLGTFHAHVRNLFETLQAVQVDEFLRRPDDRKRSVCIDCGDVRVTDFALDERHKQVLKEAGATATRAFLLSRASG